MKNVILFLALCSFCLQVYAQDTEVEKTTWKRQVSLNSTLLLAQIFSEGNVGTSPAILYRVEKKGKIRRYSFDGSIGGVNQSTEGDDSFTARANLGIGREYHKNISKKWTSYLGWEVLFGGLLNHRKDYDLNSLENLISYTARISMGAQPLVGIQFNLNERLSLSTEASVPLTLSFESSQQRGRSQADRYIFNSFIKVPASIFFNYRF